MKEVIKISRGEMIEHLCTSMAEAMLQDDNYIWSVCSAGWVGYRNMADDELVKHYREYISEDPNADIEIQMNRR